MTKMSKSKLFKLKKWLTVPEAARHLTNLFDEEVTEADVLRLALDRHLKLSVYFVNHAYARQGGKFLPYEEWEENFKKREIAIEDFIAYPGPDKKLVLTLPEHDVYFPLNYPETKDDLPASLAEELLKGPSREEKLKKSFWCTLSPEEQAGTLHSMAEYIIFSAKRQSEEFGRVPPSVSSFTGNVGYTDGVWDLPMIGAERIDVEHKFQQLTGGPEVNLMAWDGAFVETQGGEVWQIQESFGKEYLKNRDSEEQTKKRIEFYTEFLKRKIASNEINEEEAEQLLESRKQNLSRKRDPSDDYYPAGGLPNDSVLVVRTSALFDLEKRLSDEQAGGKTPSTLNPSERKSLVKMVFAMATDCYGYDPEDKKSPVTQDILNAVAKADLSISPDTVRKWLKEGAKLREEDL